MQMTANAVLAARARMIPSPASRRALGGRMNFSVWLGFVLAAFVIAVIPGPGVTAIVGYALGSGRRTALASVAGIALGNGVAMTLSLMGAGALLAASALGLRRAESGGGDLPHRPRAVHAGKGPARRAQRRRRSTPCRRARRSSAISASACCIPRPSCFMSPSCPSSSIPIANYARAGRPADGDVLRDRGRRLRHGSGLWRPPRRVRGFRAPARRSVVQARERGDADRGGRGHGDGAALEASGMPQRPIRILGVDPGLSATGWGIVEMRGLAAPLPRLRGDHQRTRTCRWRAGSPSSIAN